MIIIDLNQVFFSNLHSVKSDEIDEHLIRHTILNTIRSIRMKNKEEYGEEVILACDDRTYWRKLKFPYYKARRREEREKLDVDWEMIFNAFHNVKDELREFFPYKVIQVSGAEADDVISVIVHEADRDEPILIVSSDKDFVQLQKFKNVRQYSPQQKTYVSVADPQEYLIDHVFRGDRGDGIPNILSPDNVFMIKGTKQAAVTQKRKTALLDGLTSTKIPFAEDRLLRKRYFRNLRLIDLSYVPRKLWFDILTTYQAYETNNRDRLFNYFVSYRLKNLLGNIGDF